MAVDITRMGTKGGDPDYDTSKLRGVREERGIVTGIVKANVHGAHMGVIKIFVPTFSTDPNDKTQWRTVRYCTPYYSRVSNSTTADSFQGAKVTSGIVTPPPDLGTKVLAFFPEGRNAEGYYFACVPDTFMLQSVPEPTLSNGVASGEFNDNPAGSRSSKQISNWKKQTRPQDFFTQDQLVRSGLTGDTIRGINNSSYMRESPSELIGITSKGRRITSDGQDFTLTYNNEIKDPNTRDPVVLKGLLGPSARRKGHSITLDDGDIDGNSNQIRLRTSTGHQILMNDTEGVMYVGNADGTCWIELSNSGTMDVYAQDSVNFRSKNINFHADENIKFHSKGYTQIVSEQELHLEGKKQWVAQTTGEAGITAKGLHLNSTGDFYASASGQAYLNASGITSIAGALVLLQGPKPPAKIAKNVNVLQKEDTTFDEAQGQYILDEEQQLSTTIDRPTMHEPFIGHGTKNITTPYSGGLAGGSGGLGGAFSIVGGATLLGSLGNVGAIADLGGLSGIVEEAGVTNIAELADLGSIPGVPDFVTQIPGIENISSNLPTDSIANQFSNIAGGDLTKIITDNTGKITGLSDALQKSLPDITKEFNNILPSIQDTLPNVLNSPALNKFPVTDLIQQQDTGFSIGALESFDTQALNAAVVKQVGSLNNPAFVDSVTKSVGKYGFNVDQLKQQGLVRAEAVFNDQLSDSSMWTGKSGASSLNKFLGNSGLQETVQQAVIAKDYQTLVDQGAILAEDGKKEVMSMLTASNISSPEIASKVRQGASSIEGFVKNTTNIPETEDIASKVKQAMQTGAAASNKIEQIKSDKQLSLPADTASTTTASPRVQDESRAGERRAREETIARLTKQLADGEAAGTLSDFNKARIKANIVANRAALDKLG